MFRIPALIECRVNAPWLAAATIALLLLSSGAALAVTSTWGGGTGDWNDATNWDTDPLFPCNGQGGNDYDVIFGTGTVTLTLDCTVDSFTQTAGTMDGGFDLTIDGAMTWTAGTHRGSGSTSVGGGLAVSGSANKFMSDTRTLVHAGGIGTWSLGSIFLGSGGATFRNETTWDLTGGTRAMGDTSNSGSFENTASGVLEIDLLDAGRTITISTGSIQNDGTINANLGAIALNGDGTHAGTFAGAATVRFDGGEQTLGTGANVTVADLEVDAGTLNVDPGASYAATNTDVTGGTLNVTDAGDTVTTTTGTMSFGGIGGPGTFAATGSFGWTGGDMRGTGTTQLSGGLAVSGSANKFFEDSRTLVHAGGTGTWSLGSIFLGSGGATFRNETTWDITGGTRAMSDTSNSGSFENTASGVLNVDLTDAGRTLTISTGSIQNDGTVNANVGAIALNGDGTHAGTFAGAATVRFDGGTQTLGTGASVTVADLEVDAGTLNVDPGASYAATNTDVTGGTLNVTDAGDTVTTTTGTMSSGGIGGPGTFESTGSFGWTGGDMRGVGTTRVSGGLAVSGSANKFFEDSRTLVHAGGTGTWSLGTILMGNGGATFRNEATWNVTGGSRAISDGSDSGTFENAATGVLEIDLLDAGRTITISTGTFTNAGVIEIKQGELDFPDAFVQTAGSMRLTGGKLEGPPLLDFDGGKLEGGGAIAGDVTMAGTLAPGLVTGPTAGQLDIDGFLTLEPGSSFEVDLLGPARGSEYDSVTATGSVTLDGAFGFDVLQGFAEDAPGESFIVLEQIGGSPLSGAFTNVANGERLFNAALDSVVVRYGPGSPAGANKVVLEDYVMFFDHSGLLISGTSAGGTLTIVIDGVTVVVVLTPGMTPEQVAAAIAAAVNANSTLREMGIVAVSDGDVFFTNGLIMNKTNTDPGITLSGRFDVPALTGLGLALLTGLLALVGLRSGRRRAA